MPRRDAEEGAAGDEAAAVRLANKIRKRRAVSSSGTSDPAAGRRLRSRRPAVLLPRWHMPESSSRSRHCRGGADGTRPSASARRLVDAFWQNMDKGMLLEADAAAARRGLVPWSGASTEVSAAAFEQIDYLVALFGGRLWVTRCYRLFCTSDVQEVKKPEQDFGGGWQGKPAQQPWPVDLGGYDEHWQCD